MRSRPLLAALVALPLLAACSSGQSCDELPRLQAEREQARADYLELTESGASGEVTGQADEELHELERRVYEVEQACDRR